MKRMKKLLFIVVLSLVFIPNYFAFEIDDAFTMYSSDKNTSTGFSWWDGLSYDYYKYQISEDATGKVYMAHCIDPGLAEPTAFRVSRKLMDPESSENLKKSDYGILSIIYSDMPSSISNEYQFGLAKDIAIRTFANGILGWGNPRGEKATKKVNSLKQTATKWCGEAKKRGVNITCPNYIGDGLLVDSSANPIAEAAKELVINALDKMSKYDPEKLAGVKTDTLFISKKTSSQQSKIAILKVTISNFDPDKGEFYYLDENFTNDSRYQITKLGYSLTLPTDEHGFTAIPSGNLISTIKSNMQNGKVTLYFGYKVDYEIDEEDESGLSAVINVHYKYNDPNLYSGAVLYAKGTYDLSNLQRFIIDSKEPVEDIYPIKVKISGSACEPTVDMPNVCEDGLDADENGNVVYDFRESYVSDSYKIKTCVLKNATDAQGNSYKLIDNDNASMVANNPYCSIYCKEDFEITAPYKRYSAPGRYFQIDVAIKGKQDCYSSKLDNDKYNEDLVEAERNLADAFNNWQYYYELINNSLVTDYSVRDVCGKRTCTDVPVRDSKGKITSYDCSEGSTEGNYQYEQKIDFKKTYYSVDDNGNWKVKAKPSPVYFGSVEENEYGSCSASCSATGYTCTFKTPTEDYNDKLSGYKSSLASADIAVSEAIEALKQIIDKYNSCVGSSKTHSVYEKYSETLKNTAYWDMLYTFEPEISYTYDEPVPSDPSIPKWITEVQNIGADYMTTADLKIESEYCKNNDRCNEVDASSTVKDIFKDEGAEEGKDINVNTYCDGEVNDDYTCQGTSSTSLSLGNFDMKKYWMCEKDGDIYVCNNSKEFNVTKLDYVHRTAVGSASYITPRVYYSMSTDASIVITDSESWPENSEQVKGVPVGQNTLVGTYFYILTFSNMGKYYSEGNRLGRIYSNNTDSLINYVNESSDRVIDQGGNEQSVKANSYACSYDVNQDTCEDASGNVHTIYECKFGEGGLDTDWDSCKARLCPKTKSYCVKEAKSYYVCDKQYVGKDANCTPYGSRDEAINAADENYSCCPDCIITRCPDCIITTEKPEKVRANYTFNTISPSKINPYNREMGYNWSVNSSNVLIAQKAENTIEEIEARANVDVESLTEEDILDIDEYTLKVTMTPSMISWIKSYNSSLTDSGGYINNENPDGDEALKCYDYTLETYGIRDKDVKCNAGYVMEGNKCVVDPCEKDGYTRDANGKCIMAQIFCYSTFIDELSDKFPDNVDAPKRTDAKDEASSNFKTYISKYTNNITGNVVTNDYWTIYQYIGTSATTCGADVNCDGIPDIGPSWK